MKQKERLEKAKSIDRKILGTVDNILTNLEESAEPIEYKKHILNRKRIIKKLFQEFDIITFEVDRKKELLPQKEIKVKEYSHEYQLDRIIKIRISNELEIFYQKISRSNINDQSAILTQLTDRKIRLDELFDKYYLYKEYLEDIDPEL